MIVLSKEESSRIDRLVLKQNISLEELIFEVGKELSLWFKRYIPKKKSIVVLCGPGNNGGDGLALSHFLLKAGYPVKVYSPFEHNHLSDKVRTLHTKNPNLISYDIIVDALFGVGLDRPLESPFKELVSELSHSQAQIIAIDIPSGIDADTGQCFQPHVCAQTTLVVAVAKRGHFQDKEFQSHFFS